jgi:hypothetical protein
MWCFPVERDPRFLHPAPAIRVGFDSNSPWTQREYMGDSWSDRLVIRKRLETRVSRSKNQQQQGYVWAYRLDGDSQIGVFSNVQSIITFLLEENAPFMWSLVG